MKYLAWCLLAALTLLPLGASAAVFLSDEQALSLKQPVDDDVFATGETILIDQPITGDVFAAGERVTISDTISEDVFAAGGIVEIQGNVQDDLFAAGNTVTISGQADDVFAAGSEITFSDSATIAGDAYLTGQTIELAGEFAGDVRIGAQTIVLTEGTTINGDLITRGGRPLIEQNVTITGAQRHEASREPATKAGLGSLLISIGMWFTMGLLARYLLPGFTALVLTQPTTPLKAFVVGLSWLILFIPAAVLVALTIIGIPLAVMIILATILLVISATTYVTLFLGRWAQKRFGKSDAPLSWHYILLGAVIYSLLKLVPLIGTLVCIVLTIWALGMLLRALWSRRHVAPTV